MTAQDYEPGDLITTPELLRDVLMHEDGIYLWSAFWRCADARDFPLTCAAALDECRVFRAVLNCPQTAQEMRSKP